VTENAKENRKVFIDEDIV